jgi:hypothetical protein
MGTALSDGLAETINNGVIIDPIPLNHQINSVLATIPTVIAVNPYININFELVTNPVFGMNYISFYQLGSNL